MEPLAFVEIIDRHKDVLARHAVYRWPATIGRGYGADVIVDDPYIAPVHVTIEPATDEEQAELEAAFAEFDLTPPARFRRIVAGRKLWNFEKHELEIWRAAL